MNSYILANQMASQHHRELINDASRWRRGREARRAAHARHAQQSQQARAAQIGQAASADVYCRRAAAYTSGCAA